MTLHNLPTASTTHPLASSIIRAKILREHSDAIGSVIQKGSADVNADAAAFDAIELVKSQLRMMGVSDDLQKWLGTQLA